jgi:hypothetical protein
LQKKKMADSDSYVFLNFVSNIQKPLAAPAPSSSSPPPHLPSHLPSLPSLSGAGSTFMANGGKLPAFPASSYSVNGFPSIQPQLQPYIPMTISPQQHQQQQQQTSVMYIQQPNFKSEVSPKVLLPPCTSSKTSLSTPTPIPTPTPTPTPTPLSSSSSRSSATLARPASSTPSSASASSVSSPYMPPFVMVQVKSEPFSPPIPKVAASNYMGKMFMPIRPSPNFSDRSKTDEDTNSRLSQLKKYRESHNEGPSISLFCFVFFSFRAVMSNLVLFFCC